MHHRALQQVKDEQKTTLNTAELRLNGCCLVGGNTGRDVSVLALASLRSQELLLSLLTNISGHFSP